MDVQTKTYLTQVSFSLEECIATVYEKEEVFSVEGDNIKILSTKTYSRIYNRDDDISSENEVVQKLITNYWETYVDDRIY
jgi:hypothetical protein